MLGALDETASSAWLAPPWPRHPPDLIREGH